MSQPIIGIEGEVQNSNLIKFVCWLDGMRSSAEEKVKGQVVDCSWQDKAKNQIEITVSLLIPLSLMEHNLHLLSYTITCMNLHPCLCPFFFSFDKFKTLFLGTGDVNNHCKHGA